MTSPWPPKARTPAAARRQRVEVRVSPAGRNQPCAHAPQGPGRPFGDRACRSGSVALGPADHRRQVRWSLAGTGRDVTAGVTYPGAVRVGLLHGAAAYRVSLVSGESMPGEDGCVRAHRRCDGPVRLGRCLMEPSRSCMTCSMNRCSPEVGRLCRRSEVPSVPTCACARERKTMSTCPPPTRQRWRPPAGSAHWGQPGRAVRAGRTRRGPASQGCQGGCDPRLTCAPSRPSGDRRGSPRWPTRSGTGILAAVKERACAADDR